MITTDLTTLKINKLTKSQYEAALAAGNINENELYMTPESESEGSALPSVTHAPDCGYLVKNKGSKDLEKAIKLRRATISGVLKTMEKKNLITRVISSKDARVKKIILSDKTKKMYLWAEISDTKEIIQNKLLLKSTRK